MDDPLVGVTIWQSAQLMKKAQVREGFLKELGVDDVVLNGTAGGKRTASTTSAGRNRTREKRDGRSKRQETAAGRQEFSTVPLTNDHAENSRVQEGHQDEDDDEEELTESSMLCHDRGERKMPPSTTTSPVVDHAQLSISPVPQPQNFWLMRLFESKLFDMSIAIGYFFNSKEADVQAYLGNKLFVSR